MNEFVVPFYVDIRISQLWFIFQFVLNYPFDPCDGLIVGVVGLLYPVAFLALALFRKEKLAGYPPAGKAERPIAVQKLQRETGSFGRWPGKSALQQME